MAIAGLCIDDIGWSWLSRGLWRADVTQQVKGESLIAVVDASWLLRLCWIESSWRIVDLGRGDRSPSPRMIWIRRVEILCSIRGVRKEGFRCVPVGDDETAEWEAFRVVKVVIRGCFDIFPVVYRYLTLDV